MQALNIFIEDLLLEAWFTQTQISDDLIQEVMEVLIDRIVTVMVTHLSDADKVAFLDMTENGQSAQAFAFAQQKIANYPAVLEKILTTFKTEYLRDMQR